MSKGTSIKEALGKWEEKNGKKAAESTEVQLCAMIPPIEKMDASLSTLVHCQKLSLSSNNVEKIANLNGLKNLKILSLGRNGIKQLSGLEAVAESLEELWISYNQVEKLKGVNALKNLRVLLMSHNNVKTLEEVGKLHEIRTLSELVMVGNPVEENTNNWHEVCSEKLPQLRKLDGIPIIKQEEED